MAGRWLFAFPRVALADSLYPWRHDSVDRSGLQAWRIGRQLLFAWGGAVAGMWQYDAFAPIGYGLRNLQLFSGVHVIGVPDHDGIHATGTAGLTLNR